VTWAVQRTPGHLRDARDRARELGNERLADYYARKVDEEVGHDAWGHADLESLTRIVAAPTSTTKSMLAIDAYNTELIERDPTFYLPYVAFAEYVTVLLGPELLQNIQEKCGVPRTSMTVVDNHVELDRDHAEEDFGAMDDLVLDPAMLAPMRQVLARICGYFDAFCEEVTEVLPEMPQQADVSAA
jgi:hypothetical protein